MARNGAEQDGPGQGGAGQGGLELAGVIADRWSPRAFDAGAALGDDEARSLFEAARWAASHGNTQPARFLLARRGEQAHERVFAALSRGNRTWAGSASALVVAALATSDAKGPLPNAEFGLGLAVQNLVLQAVHLGLVAHQMGGFDPEALREAFSIPQDVRPVVVIAIGREGDGSDLPEDLREKDKRPRRRKPLAETVFSQEWGEAAFTPEAPATS